MELIKIRPINSRISYMIEKEKFNDSNRIRLKLYKLNGKPTNDWKMWSGRDGTGPIAKFIHRENIETIYQ
jgi:hypothetical protein